MILDEGFDGNVFYGPSLSLYREPFVNERYLFRDGRYHNCGAYLDMEKKFFSENQAIVRDVFFDTNNLLGVDSEEDLDVDDAVDYEDLVPENLSEENQRRHAAVREIMEMKIVRMSPILESEDEETMERVASPMVVETISDLTDTDVATCSTDIDVDNPFSLTSAAEPDCAEKIVTVRVELPSVPGPYSEDVSMNDFVPRTRLGPVLFLTFREPASGEVSVYFQFLSSGVYFVIKFWRLVEISV
jgi:hypothetical protein